MAAPMIATISSDSSDIVMKSALFCDIEATVATGFETVAKEEAEEKLKAVVRVNRGSICVHLPVEKAKQVLDLGSIDNCSVLINRVENFGFTDDEKDNMTRLRQHVGTVDWAHGLMVWRKFFTFEHPIADKPECPVTYFGEPLVSLPRPGKLEGQGSKRSRRKKGKKKGGQIYDEKKKEVSDISKAAEECVKVGEILSAVSSSTSEPEIAEKIPKLDEGVNNSSIAQNEADDKKTEQKERKTTWNPLKPSFRVTCNRTGDNHCFHSMTAASNFGGAVNEYFGWNVQMKNFDIEVILNIDDQEVNVSIGLTRESLHKRNIGFFGPTTLRPTIAYSMLRLCNIRPGDVVCDPMCGTGSIPIQAAISWPQSYHIGGDISKKILHKSSSNLQYQAELRQKKNKTPLPVNLVNWDVSRLPLRDKSVDVFVTDLPFGIRSGSKLNNWQLYSGALTEMARVCVPETGRVCLLTQDKKCMIKTLQMLRRYWFRHRTLGINLGGLAAGIYVLHRTQHPVCKSEIQSVASSPEPDDSSDLPM